VLFSLTVAVERIEQSQVLSGERGGAPWARLWAGGIDLIPGARIDLVLGARL